MRLSILSLALGWPGLLWAHGVHGGGSLPGGWDHLILEHGSLLVLLVLAGLLGAMHLWHGRVSRESS